jgi:hypothetical protein
MKPIKIILKGFLFLLCVCLVWIALTFLNYRPYKLTNDYYFVAKGKEYSINKGLFSSALIEGKTSGAEWMISDQYIYGYNKAITNAEYDVIEYYIIDREKGSIQVFDNGRELNRQLTEKGLAKYNMSDSENLAHLKFNNRKFKI